MIAMKWIPDIAKFPTPIYNNLLLLSRMWTKLYKKTFDVVSGSTLNTDYNTWTLWFILYENINITSFEKHGSVIVCDLMVYEFDLIVIENCLQWQISQVASSDLIWGSFKKLKGYLFSKIGNLLVTLLRLP